MQIITRNQWTFPYPVGALLGAARAKLKHHEGRVKWWQDKLKKAIKRVPGGLRIHQNIAASYGQGKTQGARINLQIDTETQSQLDECQNKIVQHLRQVADYQGWVQVLAAQPKQMQLQVNHDDYLFFFGQ